MHLKQQLLPKLQLQQKGMHPSLYTTPISKCHTLYRLLGLGLMRIIRKKYLKMRHKFREMMRESNTLLEEEQQLEATARRLKEGNEYIMPFNTYPTRANRLSQPTPGTPP